MVPLGVFVVVFLGCFAVVWSVSAGFCGQCSWWDITYSSSHGMLGSSPGKGLLGDRYAGDGDPVSQLCHSFFVLGFLVLLLSLCPSATTGVARACPVPLH